MSHVGYYSDISFVTKTTVRTVNDVPFFYDSQAIPLAHLVSFITALHVINLEFRLIKYFVTSSIGQQILIYWFKGPSFLFPSCKETLKETHFKCII